MRSGLTLTLASVGCLGWTDSGHMITAKIAWLALPEDQRSFLDSVTDRLYSQEVRFFIG